MQRKIIVLDAPSNLGLRPPAPGVVPGCYKLPWALRDQGLLRELRATDAGSLVPPRYYPDWNPGEGDRNALSIARFSLALADRLESLAAPDRFVLVLGGDCSILVGNALALKRLGRYGLVFLDAHSDFRHPLNAPAIGAAAGEDLAIVTGRGDSRLINLEGRGPYLRDEETVIIGVRPDDEYLVELAERDINVLTSTKLTEIGTEQAASQALEIVTTGTDGFWIHLDLDVVDADEMPAVDCPEPAGLSFPALTALLGRLAASRRCVGLEITIFDPDLDPGGYYAGRVVNCITEALRTI